MDVELEGAIESIAGGTPVGDDSAWKWAAGLFGTAVLALLGWVVKRQRSGQVLEDTENEAKSDYILRLQKRNRELEEQLGEIMTRSMAGYDEIGQAKRAANQASIEADNAKAAAQRASDAATHAQSLARAADDVSAKRLAYIHELRALLIANNVPLPHVPEGVL